MNQLYQAQKKLWRRTNISTDKAKEASEHIKIN